MAQDPHQPLKQKTSPEDYIELQSAAKNRSGLLWDLMMKGRHYGPTVTDMQLAFYIPLQIRGNFDQIEVIDIKGRIDELD